MNENENSFIRMNGLEENGVLNEVEKNQLAEWISQLGSNPETGVNYISVIYFCLE